MGQELELIGGRLNASTISELSTTLAWRQLTNGGDNRAAAEELAKSPALIDDVRQSIEAIERLAAPAGDEGVFKAMQPLLIMYGRPKKADQELQIWWGLYYDALRDQPRAALDEAVSEYMRTSEIHAIPAPGPLTKLAEPHAFKIRKARYRGQLALKMDPPKLRKPPTAEEIAAVRAMTAELHAKPVPEFPTQRESRQQMAERLRTAAPPA